MGYERSALIALVSTLLLILLVKAQGPLPCAGSQCKANTCASNGLECCQCLCQPTGTLRCTSEICACCPQGYQCCGSAMEYRCCTSCNPNTQCVVAQLSNQIC